MYNHVLLKIRSRSRAKTSGSVIAARFTRNRGISRSSSTYTDMERPFTGIVGMARSTGERLAQYALEHLAGGIAREVADELDRCGALVGGQVLPGVGDQVRGVGRGRRRRL